MFYRKTYLSKIGKIYLESDGKYLTGLMFSNFSYESKHNEEYKTAELPIFDKTIKWLDIYFNGEEPNFIPEYKINNITSFRKKVIDIMLEIPFGKVVTYRDIAKKIAKERSGKMSAQAVGRAVGSNPIYIIIPCHRVVGIDNNLVGYGGGIENKIALLEIEGDDISSFKMPKQKTKLNKRRNSE